MNIFFLYTVFAVPSLVYSISRIKKFNSESFESVDNLYSSMRVIGLLIFSTMALILGVLGLLGFLKEGVPLGD